MELFLRIAHWLCSFLEDPDNRDKAVSVHNRPEMDYHDHAAVNKVLDKLFEIRNCHTLAVKCFFRSGNIFLIFTFYL